MLVNHIFVFAKTMLKKPSALFQAATVSKDAEMFRVFRLARVRRHIIQRITKRVKRVKN